MAIGEWRKPRPNGKPGYLRVDTVHQGDLVACVSARAFHSDNGSEFINDMVSGLLQELLIEQTKSRARKSNDNGLVESKNGAVMRKHISHGHRRRARRRHPCLLPIRLQPVPELSSPKSEATPKPHAACVKPSANYFWASVRSKKSHETPPRLGAEAPWKCRTVENEENQN